MEEHYVHILRDSDGVATMCGAKFEPLPADFTGRVRECARCHMAVHDNGP